MYMKYTMQYTTIIIESNILINLRPYYKVGNIYYFSTIIITNPL